MAEGGEEPGEEGVRAYFVTWRRRFELSSGQFTNFSDEYVEKKITTQFVFIQ